MRIFGREHNQYMRQLRARIEGGESVIEQRAAGNPLILFRKAGACAHPRAGAHVNPRLFVLIPCAGAGMRASASLPKQYQWIAGRPLLYHTLSAFNACPE